MEYVRQRYTTTICFDLSTGSTGKFDFNIPFQSNRIVQRYIETIGLQVTGDPHVLIANFVDSEEHILAVIPENGVASTQAEYRLVNFRNGRQTLEIRNSTGSAVSNTGYMTLTLEFQEVLPHPLMVEMRDMYSCMVGLMKDMGKNRDKHIYPYEHPSQPNVGGRHPQPMDKIGLPQVSPDQIGGCTYPYCSPDIDPFLPEQENEEFQAHVKQQADLQKTVKQQEEQTKVKVKVQEGGKSLLSKLKHVTTDRVLQPKKFKRDNKKIKKEIRKRKAEADDESDDFYVPPWSK